jgi:RimJ/RimL family protein N-acetyltransferase
MMWLRNVEPGDVDAYVRMRCDPVMMAELGGPQPRDGIEDKVRRDVAEATSDRAWICMILPDETDSATVAGSVSLWTHEDNGGSLAEIGWMVLPEFQGRGVGRAAVRLILQRARTEDRWSVVHAFPGITNTASNGICRSLGFTLVGQTEAAFAGRRLPANHWLIRPMDLRPDLPPAS